ncbi:MAG: Spy/CpxP family protein refolding chaperone [Ramlibacter sp.]|nr:Spy/CpxP family protein refolding chaperone [Ramlibacter sp.]
MTHSPRHLIAAALLATLSLVATAQTPAPAAQSPGVTTMGHKERMERFDPARMREHRARRQARLKETLQIAPAQEGAWTAWSSAMQPPANWKRPDRAELARLPTPERIDRMRALRVERMAMIDKRADATKAFYATLDPVQQRVFDLQTIRGGQRGNRDGGYPGHHRRHHMG